MADVVDRLETVTRDFPRALFYGVGGLRALVTEKSGVGAIIEADLAQERVSGASSALVFDEDASPFAPASFDLIVSLLTLHASNDPVGALAQMRAALAPDGLLIAVLFAEETLKELRAALYEAEAEHARGVSPRVAPFASVQDLGMALQRAGFALPVVDIDAVTVRYADADRLFGDLRGIGETNCLAARGRGLRRDAAAAAAARLASSGSVRFDLATLTAWAPHPDQPKPLRPGSAAHSLQRAVEARRAL